MGRHVFNGAEYPKGLEEVRDGWFGLCMTILTAESEKESEGDDKIRIIRKTLEGNGLRAVKAYQLYLVSGFIAQHAYIKPQEGKDFADILYAQVCGVDLEECLNYLSRYHEMIKDGGTQLFRFTSDVAKHITDNPAPLIESLFIAETFPLFALYVHMVVADAFGDLETVATLEKNLSEMQ